MEIDDIVGELHDDRSSTLEEQLVAIERDIAQRHLLSVMTTNTFFDELRKVNQEIMKLLPEHPGAPDPQRAVRERLEHEARFIEQAINNEQRERWRDLQGLRRERRVLLREHREAQQRYERLTGTYH